MYTSSAPLRKQRGAALIVGLILLVILTLLAVAGMNTASTELVMAGNEQYRLNAHQAADTGVEQALGDVADVGTSAGAALVVPETPVTSSTTEQYSTTTRFVGFGTAVPGSSFGKYVAAQYEITSTGTSSRNATVTTVQGAGVVQSTGADESNFGP